MRMDIRRVVTALVGALLLSGMAGLRAAQPAGNGPRLADRVVTSGTGLQLQSPESPLAVKAAMEFTARTARVPMGIELLPAESLPQRVVRRPVSAMMAVDTMTVSSILDRVRQANPKYECHEVEGLIQVAPTDSLSNSAAPLNRAVAAVDLPTTDATEALAVVRRVFDPNYVLPKQELYIGTHYSPEALQQGGRKFALRFPGGTVRQLLNAIVKAHGDLLWIVEYKRPPATPETMVLSVRSFEGWGVTLSAPLQQQAAK
jgi:hypothetical protein